MKWFKKEEFRCRCCGQQPCEENIEALVANVLDPARERLGMPIEVNSGYRCPKHNKEVGGVPRRQHTVGEAADIRPTTNCTNNTNELARLAKKIVENGRFDQLIIYPNFIHVSWKRVGLNRRNVLKKTASGYVPVKI
jgi:hypothetical protein